MRHLLLFLLLARILSAVEPPPPIILEDFNRPFLFSYLSWQDKAFTTNGVAVLRGVNNQGGAGLNGEWNIADQGSSVPALRVKIGPDNQCAALILMLKDSVRGEGRWEFPLPSGGSQSGFVTVLPREGASLLEPNAVGEGGRPDLGKLRQLQIIGDWAGAKPVDVEVDAVIVQVPTAEVLAARETREKRLAAEAETKRRDRADLLGKYGTRSEKSPAFEHVSAVAPDVLAIEIQAGRLIPGELVLYQSQAGDQRREQKNQGGEIEAILLERNGKTLGWLVGTNREWLTTYEEVQGDPLLDFLADDAATFGVGSTNDPAFSSQCRPAAVHRKSHVNAWAQGPSTVAVRHTLYLRLPRPLTPGKSYTVDLGPLNTRQTNI